MDSFIIEYTNSASISGCSATIDSKDLKSLRAFITLLITLILFIPFGSIYLGDKIYMLLIEKIQLCKIQQL